MGAGMVLIEDSLLAALRAARFSFLVCGLVAPAFAGAAEAAEPAVDGGGLPFPGDFDSPTAGVVPALTVAVAFVVVGFAAAAAHTPFGGAASPPGASPAPAATAFLVLVAAAARLRSAAEGHATPFSFAARRSFVTMISRRVWSGEPRGSPPMDGLKSPPRVAVTASMMGEGPIGTCAGNAETSRLPGGAPRPPCHASACSFHLGAESAS